MRLSIFVTIVSVLVLLELSLSEKSGEKEEEDSSGEITIPKKKKNNKIKSTSSSSGADRDSGSGDDESLGDDAAGSSSSSSENKKRITKPPKYIPKSSEERKGWRKWHRKCKRCPEDMKKKWRDLSIGWICGGYQRARRSFKSKCMMEYRNCQDGTMFVKITAGRCKNETKNNTVHGDHWFYEYKVTLSYESDDSKKSTTSTEEDSASSTD